MSFVLFGTSGCHLCEEAEKMIAASFYKIRLETIDIAEQEQWQEQYAIKIPVLYHSESGKELFWPFSEIDVDEFIGVVRSG
jgi:allophanate hydrolase subunit 1